MKLLLVNPNITAAMTESMAAEARRFASPARRPSRPKVLRPNSCGA